MAPLPARRSALATMTAQRVSVKIPAHNEAKALPRCLGSLVRQDYRGRMHIVVVANGCRDRTAAIALSYEDVLARAGHRLTVVQTPNGGKGAALDAADAISPDGIHVYLDADVELSTNAITAVAGALDGQNGIHLCAPRLHVAPARCWVTRCYGRVWSSLPYIRNDMIGCGFYAVSNEGRQRWGRFPEIFSDDKFVRLLFSSAERAVLPQASFTVQMPEGLAELVRVRGRWCRGNRELRRSFPELSGRDRGRYRTLLPFFLTRPDLWPALAVFVPIYLAAKITAYRSADAPPTQWERAETARAVLAAKSAA